jgi:uncharacterized protein YmfQ (DUF2313 family)
MTELISKYLRLLQSLLPWGKAWNREEDSVLTQLLTGQAVEFARVETRSRELAVERDVRTSTELLGDYEEELGLPDLCFTSTLDPFTFTEYFSDNRNNRRAATCFAWTMIAPISDGSISASDRRHISGVYPFHVDLDELITSGLISSGEILTVAQRRIIAYNKLTLKGRQNRAYFIELAATLGIPIEIIEFTPFWCGVGASGDPCGGQETIFYWKIQIPFGTHGSVLCTIEKVKPAHTKIIWDYAEAGFDGGFSPGFDVYFYNGGFGSGFDRGFEGLGAGGFDYYGFSSGFDNGTR